LLRTSGPRHGDSACGIERSRSAPEGNASASDGVRPTPCSGDHPAGEEHRGQAEHAAAHAEDLVEFLDAKGKFIAHDGGLQTSPD